MLAKVEKYAHPYYSINERRAERATSSIRRKLGLLPGDRVYFSESHDQCVITKFPPAPNWLELTQHIPHERVVFDQNGHYDAKQSPSFDKWMHEDD